MGGWEGGEGKRIGNGGKGARVVMVVVLEGVSGGEG